MYLFIFLYNVRYIVSTNVVTHICLINSFINYLKNDRTSTFLASNVEAKLSKKVKIMFSYDYIVSIKYNDLEKRCFLSKSFMSRFFLHKTIRYDNFQRVTSLSLRHLVGKLKSCFKEESFARCTNCIHRREYPTGFLSTLLLLRVICFADMCSCLNFPNSSRNTKLHRRIWQNFAQCFNCFSREKKSK